MTLQILHDLTGPYKGYSTDTSFANPEKGLRAVIADLLELSTKHKVTYVYVTGPMPREENTIAPALFNLSIGYDFKKPQLDPVLASRDKLWCEALIASLSVDDIAKVTAYVNKHRTDR